MFIWLRYFTKCFLIVIKLIAKICYIAFHVLFGKRATVEFINSKICVSIYNSFTNIALTPVSVLKLTRILNILTKQPPFSITSGTFRFFGVSVSNFRSNQIVLKGASFTILLRSSFLFLIRRKKYLCLIWNFLKISQQRMVR